MQEELVEFLKQPLAKDLRLAHLIYIYFLKESLSISNLIRAIQLLTEWNQTNEK